MTNPTSAAPPASPLSQADLRRLGASLVEAFEPCADELPASLAVAVERLALALAELDHRAARAIQAGLVVAMPALRRFAVALTHDEARSDDLVQDTLLRAWANAASFRLGTNLNAWLFTILRNRFYSDARKRSREVEDADGMHAGRLVALPDQEARIELDELRSAMRRLPEAQREALLLVGAQSFSYEEAAGICGVAVGTMKSRVSRARAALATWLALDDAGASGADAVTREVMGAA